MKRPGRSFYASRHSFRTVADETLDLVAVALIMGHIDSNMADAYRERISDDRLRRIVNYVYDWLFADLPAPGDKTTAATSAMLETSEQTTVDDDDAPTLKLFAG